MKVDEDLSAFRDLQRSLPRLWDARRGEMRSGLTSVVVPSLSLDQAELAFIQGVGFYDERLLFLLMRLRDPRARVLYVTSQPVHEDIVDYYLNLLVGVPASHARKRLGLFSTYDSSPQSLTQKVLDRPRLIRRIRAWVGDRRLAYLTCFNTTALERRLAVELDLPLNGADPDLLWIGTKAGARRIFAEVGAPHATGAEARTRDDVVAALQDLADGDPTARRAVIKLNEGFSGEGNAIVTLRDEAGALGPAEEAIAQMTLPTAALTAEGFLARLATMGGIVEAYLDGEDVRSPSVQLRVRPAGRLEIVSTHEQTLEGPTRQIYVGCRFPACEEYRADIQRWALLIGERVASLGVIGRFGVDFVTRRVGGGWDCRAIEINLRMGGTTHPFLALQFLTGGAIDPVTGEFTAPDGAPRTYVATDNLKSPAYRGLTPEDFIEILTDHGLLFRPSTGTGVVFHMLGALSQYGKVGLTAIASSAEKSDELFRRVGQILDSATGAHGPHRGRRQRLFDERWVDIE